MIFRRKGHIDINRKKSSATKDYLLVNCKFVVTLAHKNQK